MKIAYELNDHEKPYITPLKLAEALIDDDRFSNEELKELIVYLLVYTRYNKED